MICSSGRLWSGAISCCQVVRPVEGKDRITHGWGRSASANPLTEEQVKEGWAGYQG